MERLRWWRQAAKDDAHGDGVFTPVLPARAAEGLCPDSSLRFSLQPIPQRSITLVPKAAGDGRLPTGGVLPPRPRPFDLALPTLRRGHGRRAETYRGRTLVVLLRFVMTTQLAMTAGRAYSTPLYPCASRPAAALPADSIACFRSNPGSTNLHSEQCLRTFCVA